jgi:hypothetical protein
MQNHWSGYLNAVGATPQPLSSTTYLTSDSRLGVSGFLDLTPKKPEDQSKYDAMSGSWAGVDAAEQAIRHGAFKTSSMPLQQKYPYSK